MKFAYVIAQLRDQIAYHNADMASDPELHKARIAEIECAIAALDYDFVHVDPRVANTFCKPSTFDMNAIEQQGRIISITTPGGAE